MTIYQFQEDLAEEIEKILSDMLLKDPKGELTTMKAYCQEVPKRKQEIKIGALMDEDDSEDEDPYPFCIVKAESGGMSRGEQQISIILIIAVFNDDAQNSGHQELINVFSRIAERFIRNPVLKERYTLDQKEGINWILDDEDRFPYFIGGMTMKWETFFMEKEDDYV